MNLKSDIPNLESAMKTTTILTATLGLAMGSLHAQTVPLFINYQGNVTDSTGTGLGTGTPVNRKVIFRIFDAPTGGNRLWSEQHTVTISNGEFSVLLGNGINANYAGVDEAPLKTNTPLDTVFTSAGILRYVEIVVDNGDNTLNGGDAPIAPRQQITSTAYAFRARSADSVASGTDLQLNGSSNYGLGYYGSTRLFNGTAVDGPVLFGQSGGALGSVNGGTKNIAMRWNQNGAVGIGSADLAGAASTTKLVVQGNDSNAYPMQLNIRGDTDTNKRLLLGYNTTSNYASLQAYSSVSGTTNLRLNPAGGYVGINKGTTAPTQALDVNGNGIFSGNVGIGSTSTPGEKLTIAGVTNYNNGLKLTGSGTYVGMAIENTSASGHKYDFFATNGGYLHIYDEDAAWYRMSISPDGNVGIGATAPTEKLHVIGNGLFSGNVGIGTTTPTEKLHVSGNGLFSGRIQTTAGNLTVPGTSSYGIQWENATGVLQAHIFRYASDNRLYFTNNGYANLTGVYLASGATGFTSTSDERLKSEIEPVTGILDKIKDIRVVGYNMATLSVDATSGKMKVDRNPHHRTTKGGKSIKQEIGSIAQDWMKDFPELVIEPQSDEEYYGLNYDRIGVVALGAVKELDGVVRQKDAEIDTLKSINADLAKRLELLEARDKALEARFSAIEAKLGGKAAE